MNNLSKIWSVERLFTVVNLDIKKQTRIDKISRHYI